MCGGLCGSDTPGGKAYACSAFAMNSNLPPQLPSQPSTLRRYGCLIVLVAVLTLAVVGALVAYHMVVRTPMPYRMVASIIEKGNPNVKINGLTGSLGSGLGVESITWGDDPEKRSEILDLRVKYSASKISGGQYRVVVTDAGVRKAHIDLADFGPVTTTSTSTTSGSRSSTRTSGGSSPSGAGTFEIERVSIEDVLVTNRRSDFRLSIPKIEWTGFKASPVGFDPGVLTVDSDRLMLHTSAGRKLPFAGEDVTFQKMLTGSALPLLHPAIRKPIDFIADVSFSAGGDALPFHLAGAGDQLEIGITKDGNGVLQIRELDLGSFLDPAALFGKDAAELPNHLVLTVARTGGLGSEPGKIKVVGGSFRLGAATFEVEPLVFSEGQQAGVILQAVANTEAGKIVWALPLAEFGKEYHPHFINTGLPPEEVLARVFAGKPYAQLDAQEKRAVEARRAVYFPATEK